MPPEPVTAPSDTQDSPPSLIDVPVDSQITGAWRRWYLHLLVWVITPIFAVGLAVGLIVGVLTNANWGLWIGIGAALVTEGVWLLILRTRTAPRAKVQSFMAATLQGGSSYRDAYCLTLRTGSALPSMALARAMAQGVVAAGWCNRAIRIARWTALHPVTPFVVPFAARPMDECAADFDALQAAEPDLAGDTPAAAEPATNAELHLPRWMSRNVATWGGWIITLPMLALAVLDTVLSWLAGHSFWGYPWVIIGLALASLLIPARKLVYGIGDWYVAPAVIIVRQKRVFHRAVAVRVYDRRTSVFLASTLTGSAWSLTVANKDGVDRIAASAPEAAFVLRAFLSPLTPPDVEALGDFR